jgi:hypothetical protein
VDAIGPQEARVLATERKNARIEEELSKFSRRLLALEQGIWQAWSDVGQLGMGALVTTCAATFSGYLLGCSSAGLVGYTITVKDATSSAVLGTATTTTGGAFSGSVTITSPSQSVKLTTTSIPGYTDSSTGKMFSCGSNTVGNVTLSQPAGYHCLSCCPGMSAGAVLSFTDSIFGSGTLTFNSGIGGWQGTLTGLNYAGGGGTGCAAQTSIAIVYTMTTSCAVTMKWMISTLTGCPVNWDGIAAPGANQALSVSGPMGMSYGCGASPATIIAAAGNAANLLALRASHASQTVTVYVPR